MRVEVATFMPKPLLSIRGRACTRIASRVGERVLLAVGSAPLSVTGRRHRGPAHAGDMATIRPNQHVNSYKRLWGGGRACVLGPT